MFVPFLADQHRSAKARLGRSFFLGCMGQRCDFDLSIANKDLLDRADDLGLAKGSRTGPINVGSDEAKSLGINDTLETLSKMSGRDVNAMVFEDVAAVKEKGPSMRIPTCRF